VVNIIDVREVASGLVRAALGGAFGTRIPLCGHNVRLSELTAQACALGAVSRPCLPASTRYGAALALWGEAGWGLLGMDSPVPSLPILLARYSYPMVAGELQRRLGVVPRPLASTLRDAIKWYASTGYLEHAPACIPPSSHAPSA